MGEPTKQVLAFVGLAMCTYYLASQWLVVACLSLTSSIDEWIPYYHKNSVKYLVKPI